MAYDIRLVKLINGDMVLGKYDADNRKMVDVALLQSVPTQQGVQMALLPFGYPFENEMSGEISFDHILYEYKTFPEELKHKYLEASSPLTVAGGGITAPGGAGPGQVDFSKLLKK